MHTPVEKIKERLSITDVVGGYLKLEKSGMYYKARCPFHNEKSASFFVSSARGTFHCFGCGKGGDIFTFVEEMEGADFAEALKLLADRAHVQLSDFKGVAGETNKRKKLHALLADATAFFIEERNKPENKSITEYLLERGLQKDTIEEFQIGFAPAYGNSLSVFLKSKGYTDQEMKDAGLIAQNERGSFDRFRSRIMFPIRDAQGRVVAFSGRIFGTDASKQEVAKYVNSPETSLYSKSNILFGYDMAKQSIMREDLCIIVEGQMDLIMAHQAGTKNTVAVSGTALTDAQLSLIRRFTQNIALSFDADNAGESAARRSIELALAKGMDISMIKIPGKKDPADLIKENKKLWEDAIKNKMHVVDFFLASVLEATTDARDRAKKISAQVLPYVARIASPLERGHFISKIANTAGMQEADVRDEVIKIGKEIPQLSQIVVPQKKETQEKHNPTDERIRSYLLFARERHADTDLYKKTLAEYARIVHTPEADIILSFTGLDPGTAERMRFAAEAAFGGDTASVAKELTESLALLESRMLTKELEALVVQLKQAEANKDEAKVREIIGQISTISKQVEIIKTNFT